MAEQRFYVSMVTGFPTVVDRSKMTELKASTVLALDYTDRLWWADTWDKARRLAKVLNASTLSVAACRTHEELVELAEHFLKTVVEVEA